MPTLSDPIFRSLINVVNDSPWLQSPDAEIDLRVNPVAVVFAISVALIVIREVRLIVDSKREMIQ